MYVNIMIVAACRVEVGYGKTIWANIGRNIVPAAAKGWVISEGIFNLVLFNEPNHFPSCFQLLKVKN